MMYSSIQCGDYVVIKEGSHLDWCLVKEVKVENDLMLFTLISKLNGKTHTVSISTDDGCAVAYCPWRFIPSDELTSYNPKFS